MLLDGSSSTLLTHVEEEPGASKSESPQDSLQLEQVELTRSADQHASSSEFLASHKDVQLPQLPENLD